MRSRVLVPIALAGLLLAGIVSAAAEPLVLYPPDRTLVLEPKVPILASRPGNSPPVDVKVNGTVVSKLEGEGFLKGEAPLTPGLNIIEAGEGAIWVYYLAGGKMTQFRLPGEKEGEEILFRSYRLHPALDDGCEGCHRIEGGKLAQKEQKEACYACHTDFSAEEEGKKKVLHAPVEAGECTGCHDPHFSVRAKLQKLEKGCLECHDAFPSEGTVHRPVADGECAACHGPHFGYAPKQLLRAGNDLCLGCHENPHAQHRSAEVKGRLTQLPSDVPRDKGQLACRGCHAPHQSAERRLFVKPQGELCRTCHLV